MGLAADCACSYYSMGVIVRLQPLFQNRRRKTGGDACSRQFRWIIYQYSIGHHQPHREGKKTVQRKKLYSDCSVFHIEYLRRDCGLDLFCYGNAVALATGVGVSFRRT